MNRILTKIITAVFSAILTVVSMSVIFPTAYAADSEKKEYSFVSDDLGKDSSFDVSYYPEKADDYSLSVIQLAESEDKELFVYVYQPSGEEKNLRATSINISRKSYTDINPSNYILEYINSSGTLFKYIVKNFTVNSDPARFYAIPSIFRAWNKDLGDKEAVHNNTVDEVAFPVEREWNFSSINGKPYCGVTEFETIVIENKFVGFVRYPNGYVLSPQFNQVDSHFVAFSTDRDIDKLLEAKVSFETSEFESSTDFIHGEQNTWSDPQTLEKELKCDEVVSAKGNGLYAATYKWNRIQTVSDFLKGEKSENIYSGFLINISKGTTLSSEDKAKLNGMKWVLRFYESSYISSYSTGSSKEGMTGVSSVTILKLKYVYQGITYNLGVIDNKQTGERDSAGLPKPIEPIESIIVDLTDKGKGCMAGIGNILAIMLGLLFFAILIPFIPLLIQCVTFIVSFPLKLINKKREQNATNNKPKMRKEGKK